MIPSLRVSLIQTYLHWENKQLNFKHLHDLITPLINQTDLVVLPEMFTTGFSMNAATLAETMDGPTMQWLREQAQRTGAVVTGSFIAEEANRYFNRLVWMRPDGSYATYDKRHLFTYANEQQHYTAGQQRLIVAWKGWSICPLICYDLRFPVWSRNTDAYDLLLYVANFPERRRSAWNALLVARAIENQCFTIGVNRIGEDGNGIRYSGDSVVLDYAGQALCQMSYIEQVCTLSLSYADLRDFRRQFAFLPDRDQFTILP